MIRKITILLSGTLAAKLMQFVYFFLAARLLSKEQFGTYAILLTLFLIGLFPVLEWGSELIITRNSANHDHTAFKTAMFWKWISFPFIFTALGLYAIFQWNYPFPLVLVAGLLLLIRSIEQSFFAYTRGLGENKTEAIHLAISRTISLSLLLSSLFFLTLSAFWVFTFQVLGSAISLGMIHCWKLEIFTFARPQKEELIHLLKEGAPLALTAVSWLIYFKVDTLMIGRMLGENEAGYYELGYKFLEASFLLPGVIMAILYRQLSMSVQSRAFKSHLLKSFAVLFTGGMIVMIAGKLILPLIFPAFFREDQQVVPVLFQTLSWAIPLVYVGHLTTQTLVIIKKQKYYLWIMLSGALFNLILNFVMIPELGLRGAALATVITEGIIVALSGAVVLQAFLHPLSGRVSDELGG